MKNNKKKERSIVILLMVAVLLMTVGFAAYSATLNINGTAKVKGSPWDVRYDGTIVESKDSVEAVSASIDEDTNTNFTFTAKLEKPGDFYEATIKAKNYGTIDAALKKITMSTLDANQAKYLSYTVTYAGTTYSTTTDGLNIALAAGASENVVVKVKYELPESANDLPKTSDGDSEGYVSVTVSGNLYYEKAN